MLSHWLHHNMAGVNSELKCAIESDSLQSANNSVSVLDSAPIQVYFCPDLGMRLRCYEVNHEKKIPKSLFIKEATTHCTEEPLN